MACFPPTKLYFVWVYTNNCVNNWSHKSNNTFAKEALLLIKIIENSSYLWYNYVPMPVPRPVYNVNPISCLDTHMVKELYHNAVSISISAFPSWFILSISHGRVPWSSSDDICVLSITSSVYAIFILYPGVVVKTWKLGFFF